MAKSLAQTAFPAYEYSFLFFTVMRTALSDFKDSIPDAVDQAVLPVDAAAPPALKVTPQGLRLRDPTKRIAFRLPDQTIDALEHPGVLCLPCDIFLPGSL
jgi:hypothetical protein